MNIALFGLVPNPAQSSPIQVVTFGQAINTSLNDYYDLLKAQAGGLGANEFLQLKLVADGVDISDDKYRFYSYYNLLRRADLAIQPSPISDVVLTGALQLNTVYGEFLKTLMSLVVFKDISSEDQKRLDALAVNIQKNKEDMGQLYALDATEWKKHCDATGIDPKDPFQCLSWSKFNGHIDDINELSENNIVLINQRKSILDSVIVDVTDKDIIQAVFDYDSPALKLRYPRQPDYDYLPTVLTLSYLVGLPSGANSVFDDRLVISWDKTMGFIKTAVQGRLAAHFDRNTGSSSSITTDWGSSVGGGFAFIKVNASVQEHTEISNDFKDAVSIDLSADATIRVNMNYGSWFNAALFEHDKVKSNPDLFKKYFGQNGALLYYPTALILIRGFGIAFKSSSQWSFDYKKKFSAKGGGGFSAFGINFGGTASYSQDMTQHQVDQTATDLSISDAADTIRFVGYVVKKNDFFEQVMNSQTSNFGFLEED